MASSSAAAARADSIEGAETSDIVARLIESIRFEGMSAGDRLPSIRTLARRFGVSASVIRDALLRAQTIGIVEIRPRSGAFVRSVDYRPLVDALSNTIEASLVAVDRNVFDLLEARQVIEVEAIRLAAARRRIEHLMPVRDVLSAMQDVSGVDQRKEYVELDLKFHLEIAQTSGNRVLTTILSAILNLLRPHIRQVPWTDEARIATETTHWEIYQAIVDGDADRACRATRDHMQLAYTHLLGQLRMAPPQSAARKGEAAAKD